MSPDSPDLMRLKQFDTYSGGDNSSLMQSQRFSTNKSVLTSHEGWVEFEAELFEGKKCGIGRGFHKNGRLRFEGEFSNDKPNGECVTIFYNSGNIEYQGKWPRGNMQGGASSFTRTDSCGTMGNLLIMCQLG